MTDPVSEKIEALSAQLEGLETAAERLEEDPGVGVSLRRIARSLESAAQSLELTEIAAGAVAIQRAADAHLRRSVTNFLDRVAELRRSRPHERATILIVEDNRTVAAATRAYLKADGRELIVAETARAARTVLDERDVDVVILDLILPDRDGRDFLVEIREHASTSSVPVIVLSSKSGSVARAECMAVGADEFLEKPAEPKYLRAAVTRQIKSGRQRRDALRDGLTGLPNRAGIHAEFEEQRRLALREDRPLSVAIVGLDSLAEVTMKLGRDAGDRFLLEVTSGLHETAGEGDVLGRWETAELVVIQPGRSLDEAKALLEAGIASLREDRAFDDIRETGIAVSLSGGVTSVEPGQSLQDALSSARRSLYDARMSDDGGVRSGDDPPELETRRILVVEDDRVTATLLRHRLVRDGHEVVDFTNGEEAHAWAEEEDFDLAILDVKVPGMDGFELLGRIRDVPRYADVPVMMLTGLGNESDVIRGLELGADDYMLKPFSPTELLARVRRLLHAHVSGVARDAGMSGATPHAGPRTTASDGTIPHPPKRAEG